MNQTETVNAVARKLRRFNRREVREMITVLVEIWSEELLRPDGEIRIDGLGKLYIDQQIIPASGIIKQKLEQLHGNSNTAINRYYFRFRPNASFYKKLRMLNEMKDSQKK